ncbi:MAG: flagellar basal body rod protein FlgB [Comamonas sp.]
MALNFDKALGVHADALRTRAERTQLLASNLANVSTPGYQARDIDFAAAMSRASARDTAALSLDWDSAEDALYRVPNHPSQDGNTVEVGVEQALFSQNASDFQMSMTFVSMKMNGLKSAIKGE